MVIASGLEAGKKTELARSTFSGVRVSIVAMAKESSHCLILGFPFDRLSMREDRLTSMGAEGLTEFSSDILRSVRQVKRLD